MNKGTAHAQNILSLDRSGHCSLALQMTQSRLLGWLCTGGGDCDYGGGGGGGGSGRSSSCTGRGGTGGSNFTGGGGSCPGCKWFWHSRLPAGGLRIRQLLGSKVNSEARVPHSTIAV